MEPLKVENEPKKAAIAAENFKKGYNCAQSVLLAFQKEVGLDEKTVLKLASSFGGGMGRLREVCGAVSAMFMVAGLLKGYDSPNDDIAKALHYELIQNLAEEFKKCHRTIICRELLGLENSKAQPVLTDTVALFLKNASKEENFSHIPSKRTEEYYASRPCEAFIRTAAEIVEKKLLG